MTASVIALVVVASSLFLGLISSLKHTIVSAGNPLNIVVMRKGADNDGSSQLSLEAYQAIRYFDGIARDAAFSFIYTANLDLLRSMGAERP